jgi:hypothetical protein
MKPTNVEVVTKLMDFSKCGAMQQAFVLTAIEKYAEQCIAAGAKKFESEWLSGAGWIACAEEARDVVRAHLNRDETKAPTIRRSAVVVSTDEYVASHGHSPRGRGSWAFFFGDDDSIEAAWFTPGSTIYGEARQLAITEAIRRGVRFVKVGS